jgi:hypothetical protein
MIGKQPQPGGKEERKPEDIHREMITLAKQFPKPSGNKLEEVDGWTQFGNNFYMLFLAMEAERLYPNSPFLERFYIRRAEKLYGEKWEKFLQENISLLANIQEALKPLELYSKLNNCFIELVFNPQNYDLAIRVSKEINLDGIHADIWNKINQLLKQASEAMALCGIDSKNFYGAPIKK